MKKILLIICLFPILVFSQKSYKIPADSTILNNIGSGKNELVIRNATSNITGGVLTNLGNGVTAFVLGGGSARVVDTIYKNSAKDSIVFTISGIRYAVKDSIGVTDLSGYVPYTGATGDVNIGLHKYIGTALQSNISAGVSILNNTASPIGLFGAGGGINSTFYGAVKLDGGTANRILSLDGSKNIQYTVIQKVDSSYLFKNATRDSICMITIINGNTYRSCAFDSVGGGGGGASLSGLTAATATNNIFNTNYKQRWNWNTIAGDTALVIASNSVNATSNLQNLLTVSQSGANATSTQTTYGAIFSNKKTGIASTNIGAYFSASGGTTNYSVSADGSNWFSNPSITTNNLYLENTSGYGVGYTSSNHQISMRDKNSGAYSAYSSVGGGVYGLYLKSTQITATIGTTNIMQISGSSSRLLLDDGSGAQLYWNNSGIQCALNVVIFKMNNSEVARFNSSGSLGIGTTTPDASAILDLTSTTKGLAIPTMTATQASAISTPKKSLMIYVTDTNGTFTSAGWWGYNGTIWKLILAE